MIGPVVMVNGTTTEEPRNRKGKADSMNEWDAKLLAIVNRAVRKAQDENRRLGIPNVYEINGTLVWQLPDGTITTTVPMRPPADIAPVAGDIAH